MVLPSIPLSREALARATCDGEGLITIPTPDGPEHFACHGCRACTPSSESPSPQRLRLAVHPLYGLPVVDDEAW